MFELDDLRIYTTVAERGGVSAAARALDTAKSSVSRSLARIEALAGAVLVERSARRLRLTEAGATFLVHARRVLAEVEDAEHALGSLTGRPRGTLRVKSSFSIMQALIAPMLPSFIQEFPDVALALNAEQQRMDALADDADLIIRIGPLPKRSGTAEKLASPALWTCASPSYLARRGTPATFAELARHDLIGVRDPMRWTFGASNGKTRTLDFAPRVVVPEPATAQLIITAGAAIGRLPDYLAAGPVARGELVRLMTDLEPERVDIHAIAARRRVSAIARAFLDRLGTYIASVAAPQKSAVGKRRRK